MTDYYFITSKLNGFVLDIKGASTNPSTPIISYPRKSTGTDNQLWERVPTGPKDPSGGQSQYFIKSKLNGNVLDIQGANPAPATPIISYPQKTSGTNNQVWQIVFGADPNYFFIVSLLNGNVLDISGANPAPATQVISYPKKTTGTDNQLWSFVPQFSADPNKKSAMAKTTKKSAFAGSPKKSALAKTTKSAFAASPGKSALAKTTKSAFAASPGKSALAKTTKSAFAASPGKSALAKTTKSALAKKSAFGKKS